VCYVIFGHLIMRLMEGLVAFICFSSKRASTLILQRTASRISKCRGFIVHDRFTIIRYIMVITYLFVANLKLRSTIWISYSLFMKYDIFIPIGSFLCVMEA